MLFTFLQFCPVRNGNSVTPAFLHEPNTIVEQGVVGMRIMLNQIQYLEAIVKFRADYSAPG